MKKLALPIIAICALTFFSCEVESVGNEDLTTVDAKGKVAKKSDTQIVFDLSEDCQKTEAILYAGQTMEVGKITVSESGGNYIITYEITNEEWCMTGTHLSVVTAPEDFPMANSGNPKNGHFEYKDTFDCAKTATYEVPVEKGPYIAAHADMVCVASSPETIASNLPETVDICTTEFRPDNGNGGYFALDISDGTLSGEAYSAWCVDIDQNLNLECLEGVSVISTLSDLPEGLFENPGNIGAVNWLLNSGLIGAESSAFGAYTGDDLQMAIWVLLDDPLEDFDSLEDLADAGSLGTWDINRSNELVNLALENENFVPECGDVMGVVLSTTGKQPVIITHPLECSPCGETAWADGCDFPGDNWATYFQYGSAE
ncbi:hypothetical protein [Flagellimonas iocasae]|uniref:Uncharacterized protein n=1 Tax=Flagellimonas iocasae TaxID=2055905 RepID=A0ABW4XW61_9FLAO